ncbi:D-alanyl-D-alanine carboxypeptidase family protein [Bacillus sp. THAF10]|uniref:D-alanyl-D-alanine carboxypeptidase family protein n=1 Tax=Bacillus sp. THAF10 TaxID=2587848 RepID=UPI0020A68B64|nr:D-alanyl-D-alanine carboxypeptidase family protein [Bacillus sp. THAF10]
MIILLSHSLPIQAEAINEIFSESAILIDAKSGEVLYEKDSERVMYPASITKIVTALIAIEEGDMEETVTVSENARNQEGSRVYLLEGEKVSLKKLVQGLLINSGNDAGTAIAEHFDGNEAAFANRMNTFVKEQIGVDNTNFTNPHGLFHPDHVTTAKDMAKITQYALNNEIFMEIVGTKTMDWVGEGWETTLYNHHRLLWDYEGTTGVKNGYVPESGHTLVTSASRNGMDLIAVTLKASSKYYSYYDTMAILDYGFQYFTSEKIKRGQMIADASGKEYMLAKHVYVSKQEEDKVQLAVNEKKQLVVQVGDEKQIKDGVLVEKETNELSPVPSTKTETVASAERPTENKSNMLLIVFIFVCLFLFIFIISMKQKKKRRKKLEERFSNSIRYQKRSNFHR